MVPPTRLALRLLLLTAAAGCASTGASSAPTAAPGAAPPEPPGAGAPRPGERAVEAYFAPVVDACARGEAKACGRLAPRLHFATNARELRHIVAALHAGCAARASIACAGEAVAIAHGEGVPADPKRGVAMLETSCAAGEGFACGELAEIEMKGALGVTGKEEQGKRRAAEACEKHGGWPCSSATAGVDQQKEPARVVGLIQRACDGGDVMACYQLGQAYGDGAPGLVEPDATRATSLYEKGCAGDFAQACFNLAWQYERGAGVKADDHRAHELFERSCTLGDASGCDELARREGNARRYCDLWGAQACYDVALEVSQKHGETAEAAADIIDAGLLACERGHDGACRILSHVRKDFTRWCDAGEKVRDTCTFSGIVYARMADASDASAQERAEAKAKALTALGRACDQGSEPACAARKHLAP
jgi:TPR repeat protein